MKERPILFSTEMVKAILAGKKIQTRRVIKPQPRCELRQHYGTWHEYQEGIDQATGSNWGYSYKCPYGKRGDILWVREIWNRPDCNCEFSCTHPPYIYKADGWSDDGGWKPSIHMPREACRLFLKIKDIRVERLQDISEEDAKTEGCDNLLMETRTAKNNFMNLWNMINEKRGYSWNINPWVWVVEFERVDSYGLQNS